MIRDREHECMSREDLRQLQGQRLVKQVQRVYERVPFYKDLLDKAGVDPQQGPRSRGPGEPPLHAEVPPA